MTDLAATSQGIIKQRPQEGYCWSIFKHNLRHNLEYGNWRLVLLDRTGSNTGFCPGGPEQKRPRQYSSGTYK